MGCVVANLVSNQSFWLDKQTSWSRPCGPCSLAEINKRSSVKTLFVLEADLGSLLGLCDVWEHDSNSKINEEKGFKNIRDISAQRGLCYSYGNCIENIPNMAFKAISAFTYRCCNVTGVAVSVRDHFNTSGGIAKMWTIFFWEEVFNDINKITKPSITTPPELALLTFFLGEEWSIPHKPLIGHLLIAARQTIAKKAGKHAGSITRSIVL